MTIDEVREEVKSLLVRLIGSDIVLVAIVTRSVASCPRVLHTLDSNIECAGLLGHCADYLAQGDA